MLKFAWRWAQVGDKVLVHDLHQPEADLVPGTVKLVRRVNHITELGISITDNGTDRVVWPSPACVHPDPFDSDESCWMCDLSDGRVSPAPESRRPAA